MSKPKYMKGDCIRSLDDLVLQENIFWNGRIWNRKWFMNLRNGGYMIDAKEIVQNAAVLREGAWTRRRVRKLQGRRNPRSAGIHRVCGC